MRFSKAWLITATIIFSIPAWGQYLDLRDSTVGSGNKVTTGAQGWFGSSSVAPNVGDAWFVVNDQRSTGTGVIDPFLTIQNKGVEHGFNTDVKNQFDNKDSGGPEGGRTRPLLISDLQTVTVNGISYFQFLLDINEADTDSWLSLDTLQVYTGTNPSITETGATTGIFNQQLVYDMDTAGSCQAGTLATCRSDITIGSGANTFTKNLTGNGLLLDYTDNTGSGSGDLFFFLPSSLFSARIAAGDTYLYLYSKFGVVGDFDNGLRKNQDGYASASFSSEAGFEEWAGTFSDNFEPPPPPNVIPEPSTYAALAAAVLGLAWRQRNRKSAK